MSEHPVYSFKSPYKEQPNIRKSAIIARNILGSLWTFKLDLEKFANQEEYQTYISLCGQLDIFLFDFFESKDIHMEILPNETPLSIQLIQSNLSDSSSSSDYYDDDDDFSEVRDLRK